MDHNYDEMFQAIDALYFRALQIPCVALIYTTIDSLGWLAYGDEDRGSKARFIRWVEKYYIHRLKSPCSAIDLYAARCSILHGLAWESELSKAGKARTLLYFMGRDTQNIPTISKSIFSDRRIVWVHVDAMISALKDAVRAFYGDVKSQPELKERIESRRGKRYAKIPVADYVSFIEKFEKITGSPERNRITKGRNSES